MLVTPPVACSASTHTNRNTTNTHAHTRTLVSRPATRILGHTFSSVAILAQASLPPACPARPSALIRDRRPCSAAPARPSAARRAGAGRPSAHGPRSGASAPLARGSGRSSNASAKTVAPWSMRRCRPSSRPLRLRRPSPLPPRASSVPRRPLSSPVGARRRRRPCPAAPSWPSAKRRGTEICLEVRSRTPRCGSRRSSRSTARTTSP